MERYHTCWSSLKIYELTWPPVKGTGSCKPDCWGLFICLALLGDKVENETIISTTVASQSGWKGWRHKIRYNGSILRKRYACGMHYCSNLLSSHNFNKEILLRLQGSVKILNFSLNH